MPITPAEAAQAVDNLISETTALREAARTLCGTITAHSRDPDTIQEALQGFREAQRGFDNSRRTLEPRMIETVETLIKQLRTTGV